MALKKAVLVWLSVKTSNLLGGLFGLLGQKNSLDVGEDTSLSNGDSSQELVQFFVITDSQLQVTGDDTGLLVVPGGITSQLQNLGGQVLHDGGKVDGSSGTNTFSVVS